MNSVLQTTFSEVLKTSFAEAFLDCLAIIPVLFFIFFIIEVVEYFYSDKILSFSKISKKSGPLLGVILAAIPQCGLSIIASTMYTKRLITRGTLIAVYLATSDEAIPVLLASPKSIGVILPLISIKLAVALFAGYIVDLLFDSKTASPGTDCLKPGEKIEIEKGCHSHSIVKEGGAARLKELFIHPVVHTLSVAFFVLLITFAINILANIFSAGGVELFTFAVFKNNFIQRVIAGIFGIIPNCAVSVGITLMYIKGVISFASCVSGLCAGAGLGLLVLIKNNESKKDTGFILLLLLVISVLAGYLTLLLPVG